MLFLKCWEILRSPHTNWMVARVKVQTLHYHWLPKLFGFSPSKTDQGPECSCGIIIIIIKGFIKCKSLSVETILSMYIHTQVPAHASILTTQNLIYTQLETGSRLETAEGTHADSRMGWQTWELISTWKKCHCRAHFEDVLLMDLTFLAFTHMPGELL